MLANLQGWHLIVILAIVLLLFGAPKLPGLARSVGQSMRIFKSEVKTMKSDDPKSDDAAAPTATSSNVAASTIAEPAPVAKPADVSSPSVSVAEVRPADLHASESNNKL